MAASTYDVPSAMHRLAGALLDDVERIAPRSVARMQELLPSYAKVPADALIPVTLTNTRNVLEAVRDPEAGHHDEHFRVSGQTRLRQGITADEMLQAWRIGLEVVREEAHLVAKRLEVPDAALLNFVEATLQWGDIGMRRSAAAYREGEIRELERLAAEQAALRRVAMLVARECSPKEVFAKVAEELGRLLEVDTVRMLRFEPDDTVTLVAAQKASNELIPVGLNVPIPSRGVVDRIFRTGEPARVEDTGQVEGPIGESLRREGLRWAVGGPIVVDGRLWGAMVVGSGTPEGSSETERRVAEFAELVSTAISNVESRERVERLAAEQAALRRVATLVAEGASPSSLFDAVAAEMETMLRADQVALNRFVPGEEILALAHHGGDVPRVPPGSRVSTKGESATATVRRTGRPARMENYEKAKGAIAEIVRATGLRSSVAVPIALEGSTLWGVITASWKGAQSPPLNTEERMFRFAQLLATAIANAESREAVRRLADEQSALRRVAELVAREHSPEDLFTTLVQELGVLLQVDASAILRYETDSSATVVAGWSDGSIGLPVGERLPLEGENLAGEVHSTGLPRRKEDYSGARGVIAATVRELGIRSAVASPIVVAGATWGVIAVLSRRPDALPADTEARIAEFTRQAALAVANAKSRADLAESRARIVRTGDEARRRFERDLHDGAQQRLVSLGLELRAAEAALPPGLGDLRGRLDRLGTGLNEVLADLRELSRGLHPAVLSEGGLSAALSSLARRSAVPVDLRLDLDAERFHEPIEVAAYYVASEALTNTAKHAHASRAQVRAGQRKRWLELTVSDDGTGGADASTGSGLTGLIDRIEAIGGTIHIDSRPNLGTTIHAKLPIKSTRS